MDGIAGRRVVVGVSHSQSNLTPLRRAAAEARGGGRELWAVPAWEPPGGGPGHRGLSCPPRLAEFRRSAGERLFDALDTAFGSAGPGVPVRPLTVRASAGRVLVEVAAQDDDLLVVGTGPRLWHRALWPSVSHYCLAHASCAVLAVPPSPLEKELGAVRRRITWRLPLDAREPADPAPPGTGWDSTS
ncbi:universal stress protein [Streptomyces sp. NBC_01166]|uniref:universal stress protein n=1 Tax=Streptomyces sp. NBC_01166 TaxID=2903755 RepID=UPI003864D35D|nr:universal stress protein [Streptomyces sp. NBC_01166]